MTCYSMLESIPALHQLAYQCRFFCGCTSTIVEALQLLLATRDDLSCIILAADIKHRPYAYRYASDLINGRLSSAEWLPLASSGKKCVLGASGQGGEKWR